MPWVEFTENFNWTRASDRRQTTAYKAGHRVLITTACAKAAAGRFFKIPAPARGQAPGLAPEANPVRQATEGDADG